MADINETYSHKMTSVEVGTQTNQSSTNCTESEDNMHNRSSDAGDRIYMNSESGKVTEKISPQNDYIEVTDMDFGCEFSETAINNEEIEDFMIEEQIVVPNTIIKCKKMQKDGNRIGKSTEFVTGYSTNRRNNEM